MGKAQDIQSVLFVGTTLLLHVDGKQYEIDITKHSKVLAAASHEQRMKFEVSPSGYGIHWPDLDDDLSIDGLIGVKHLAPFTHAR